MYLWIIAAVAAYFIKGLCGFANTLVFTSILSFGASNANISPIDLLLGYPTNLILTWRNRKSLDPKVYFPLAALLLAGSPEKVIDVAYQAGFSSLAAFNRFFKQQTGQTPTAYRKEHQVL